MSVIDLEVPTRDVVATINRTRLDLVALGRFEEAVDFLSRCVKSHPDSHRALVLLGIESSRLYRWDEAIDAYLRALVLEPADGHTLTRLGLCFARTGQFVSAQRTYERALALDTADRLVVERYWATVQKTRRFEGVIERLESTCAHIEDSEVRVTLAAALERTGELDRAIMVLEALLEQSPDSLGGLLALGRIQCKRGDAVDAVGVLAAGVERHPGSLELALALTDAQLDAGRPADAVAVLERTLLTRTNTATLWERHAAALAAAGRSADAQASTERSRDASARTARAMELIGAAPSFRTRWHLIDHCVEVRPEEGLVLEFGVAAGMSIRYLGQRVSRVYGFDSFAGLPEESDAWVKGQFAQASLPIVPDNVELIVGWYDETLEGFLDEHAQPIGLLHIDCDIYSSTKLIFDLVRDRFVPGTVILFDELWRYGGWENHEWRALEECLLDQGVSVRFIGHLDAGPQVALQIS